MDGCALQQFGGGAARAPRSSRPRAGRRDPPRATPAGHSARRSARSGRSPGFARPRRTPAARSTGARPAEGSSSNSSSGSDISARPIAHICCSPPDNVPASWRRRSWRRGNSSIDEIEALAELRPRRGNEGAHAQIVLDCHAREQAAVFRHVRDAQLDDAMRRRGRQIGALHVMRRASAGSGRRSPASTSSCRRRWGRSPPPLRRRGPRARRRTGPGSCRSRHRPNRVPASAVIPRKRSDPAAEVLSGTRTVRPPASRVGARFRDRPRSPADRPRPRPADPRRSSRRDRAPSPGRRRASARP